MKKIWICIIFFAGVSFAEIPVSGYVLGSEGQAIVNANIILETQKTGAVSLADGSFAFKVPEPGKYKLTASHIQFIPITKTVRIGENDTGPILLQFEKIRTINFNEITVTATRNILNTDKAPQSISQLSPKDLQQQYQYNAGQALDQLPGVRVIRDGSTVGADYGLSIRSLNGGGYSNKTLVLVDGRPMNNGWNGGVNFNTIPMEIVDRIEVVKGAGSALYGSQATAGVVNVLTKVPEPGWHTWVSASKELDASDIIGDPNADGYSRPIVEANTLQWTGSYRNERSSHFVSLGLRSSLQDYRVPNNNEWNNTDLKYKYKRQYNEQLQATVHVDFHNNSWDKPAARPPVKNDYYYAGADVHVQYNGRRGVWDSRVFVNLNQDDETSLVSDIATGYTALRTGLMSNYALYLPWNEALLQFGFEGIVDNADVDYEQVIDNLAYVGVQEIDIYSRQSGLYSTLPVDLYTGEYGSTRQDYQLHNTALYMQYQQNVGSKLHAVLGARLDMHSEFGSIVNPNVGLAYRLLRINNSTTHLKLNYAKGFRAPTMIDLYSCSLSSYGDPDMQPEKTANVDVGVIQRLEDWGFVSVSAFRMQVENLMVSDKQGSTGWGQYVLMPNTIGTDTLYFDRRTNRGDYTPQGVEVAFKFQPLRGLSVNGAYTLLDPGDFTFQTSRHRYNVGLYYEKQINLVIIDLAWRYDYTGDGYFFDYEVNPYTAFALQEASIGLGLAGYYRVSLHIKNLSDTEYRLWHHTWQPGRSVIVQFEAKF